MSGPPVLNLNKVNIPCTSICIASIYKRNISSWFLFLHPIWYRECEKQILRKVRYTSSLSQAFCSILNKNEMGWSRVVWSEGGIHLSWPGGKWLWPECHLEPTPTGLMPLLGRWDLQACMGFREPLHVICPGSGQWLPPDACYEQSSSALYHSHRSKKSP